MLRSKQRSGSIDFGQKNHYSSIISRTLSASKLCRGNDAIEAHIDSNAPSSVKKFHKYSNLSKNRSDKVVKMQQNKQQQQQLEAELQRIREKLSVVEIERDQALNELKRVERDQAEELRRVSAGVSERAFPEKARGLMMELESLKELLSNLQQEVKVKDSKIQFLESKLEKGKLYELEMAEGDASLDMSNEKESEGQMTGLLSEIEERIQCKELEETKFELVESKREITCLRKKIELLENLAKQNFNVSTNRYNGDSSEEEAKAEVELLKNELKLTIEAEEKNAKAMEDLALALKEVATEANQTKEKLNNSQMELVQVKGESEGLKAMVRSKEEKYQVLLEEAKQEAELCRNTADRLKLEAEESLLAWNGKEMGFVSCIKRAEEEKAILQHECSKLRESLKTAEHTSRVGREETFKLRDILKQAISESNAAKAAASIATEENSQLKDCLEEKDEALLFLTRENERLRINEAAARENMKEYKKLLATASTELKIEDKEHYIMLKPPNSMDREHEDEDTNRTFTFNLEDLKFMDEAEEAYDKIVDDDPEKVEALKGSIFDSNALTPKAEPHTPQSVSSHRRVHSSPFTDDPEAPNSEDPDHSDNTTQADQDSERNSHRRRRTMFRRVGDLLMIRRSFHKKEASTDNHKKEASADNNKKEASADHQKKEASADHQKREASAEHQKKEASADHQKKEASADHQKKEVSAEHHKKEPSGNHQKKEQQSTEHHKTEASAGHKKEEPSADNHKKEPSPERHTKEQTKESQTKEPDTE